MMHGVGLGAVKLSFLFFYRRIFVIQKSSIFAITTAAMIIVVSMWTVVFFFGHLFACGINFSAWWGRHFETECVSLDFELSFALSDFLMDVSIMAMPIPMVSPYLLRNLCWLNRVRGS